MNLLGRQSSKGLAPAKGADAGPARPSSDGQEPSEEIKAGQRMAMLTLLDSGAFVLRLRSAVCYLPHPAKLSYGGEDAHFISEAGGGAVGVADGVGGWQEAGVNPAEYSRTFMRHAHAFVEAAAALSVPGSTTDPTAAGPGSGSDPAPATEAAAAAAAAAVAAPETSAGLVPEAAVVVNASVLASVTAVGEAAPDAAAGGAAGEGAPDADTVAASGETGDGEGAAAASRGKEQGEGGAATGAATAAATAATAAGAAAASAASDEAGPHPAPTTAVDPKGALHFAHTHTKCAGSSTAVVLQLHQSKRALVAANVGDSGFVVIRGGAIIARSRPLQHYFDCPLQFGAFPEYVDATDTAEQADEYSIEVQPGDIVVTGSDGLWDNAFDSEVIACVTSNRGVLDAATSLAALARRHASDPEFTSPYVREALSQGLDLSWWDKLAGMRWKGGRLQLRQLTGGKQDDITVIVSKVVMQAAATERHQEEDLLTKVAPATPEPGCQKLKADAVAPAATRPETATAAALEAGPTSAAGEASGAGAGVEVGAGKASGAGAGAGAATRVSPDVAGVGGDHSQKGPSERAVATAGAAAGMAGMSVGSQGMPAGGGEEGREEGQRGGDGGVAARVAAAAAAAAAALARAG